MDLSNSSILVTGGTGSFGKKFIRTILNKYPTIKRLVIYSRDELKQFEMSQEFSHSQYKGIRYFIGDVRDQGRLKRAFEGIDIVIHAAALKQVPAAEYNPFEFINTNILGAENIINASLDCGVKKVVALSTDKAAAPINLYGATKLCSDKLFIAANNIKGERDIRFSIVRYGNVMGSRGSVVPFFLGKRASGTLPITNPNMTRFNISLQEGVELVINAIENGIGGEVIVPKLPSYKISELATAIGPDCRQEVVGIRPGEKVHEDMIIESDSPNTLEFEDYYIIHPQTDKWQEIRNDLVKNNKAKSVADGFRYNSGTNTKWLDSENLRQLIVEQVDPNFK
ncbi:MAG: UDP-N-acetylglucosamine 4,6-dehydratase (inverting) [Cyclobacteriaceae bacterium]